MKQGIQLDLKGILEKLSGKIGQDDFSFLEPLKLSAGDHRVLKQVVINAVLEASQKSGKFPIMPKLNAAMNKMGCNPWNLHSLKKRELLGNRKKGVWYLSDKLLHALAVSFSIEPVRQEVASEKAEEKQSQTPPLIIENRSTSSPIPVEERLAENVQFSLGNSERKSTALAHARQLLEEVLSKISL